MAGHKFASRVDRSQDKIGKQREGRRDGMQCLKTLEVRLLDAPDGQTSLTNADARWMATSGRGPGVAGCHDQAAETAKAALGRKRMEKMYFDLPAAPSQRGHAPHLTSQPVAKYEKNAPS